MTATKAVQGERRDRSGVATRRPRSIQGGILLVFDALPDTLMGLSAESVRRRIGRAGSAAATASVRRFTLVAQWDQCATISVAIPVFLNSCCVMVRLIPVRQHWYQPLLPRLQNNRPNFHADAFRVSAIRQGSLDRLIQRKPCARWASLRLNLVDLPGIGKQLDLPCLATTQKNPDPVRLIKQATRDLCERHSHLCFGLFDQNRLFAGSRGRHQSEIIKFEFFYQNPYLIFYT
ncbi:hypothetical protein [Paraburkholderia tagetis]|uniref:Uncharacterized protein n=1 Tax=Paraburkholderia tagetis TaxID=2913261 RepID=A0A9X1UJC3_9BURK|nr:hypothetical protein [Paraburkholderia tagetis]MCG5076327.1 hypothetical protein [Paraburkholderia tagetis]